MRTKLLRKVHKEWEIMWHPDGGILWREQYPPCYSVGNIDILRQFFFIGDYENKDKALQAAKDYILKKVREQYSHLKAKKLKKPVKVWHV